MADLLPCDADLIARSEAIEQGVTPGGWRSGEWTDDNGDHLVHAASDAWVASTPDKDDAAFIAASRSLVPELRERVRVLSQVVQSAVEMHDALEASYERLEDGVMPDYREGKRDGALDILAAMREALGAALEVGESKK